MRGRQTDFERKKIEVGPPAAKRHVGKQKPKVVDDLKEVHHERRLLFPIPSFKRKMNLTGGL